VTPIDDCRLSTADWRGTPGSSRELPHNDSNQESVQAGQSTELDNRQSTILNPYAGHELWAGCYDETPNPLLELEERSLVELLANVAGSSILDVGCGTGRWLRRLAEQRPKRYVGIDFSPAMLRRANAIPQLTGHLIQAEAYEIPLKAESIDLLLCSFVLGYIEELPLFAREAHRIVKQGGLLICTDLHPAARQLGWKRSFRKGDQLVEIYSQSRTVEEISACFTSYFKPVVRKALFLGDSERLTFERAGKLDLFEEASRHPAVIVFEWRK
jgi:malonyl-CoA O-methyltransferase